MAIKHWSDARDNMSVELCSPSMAGDREEGCSESSRKMQDKEETTSEASWTEARKGKEKLLVTCSRVPAGHSLGRMWWCYAGEGCGEPEGEAERPEATVPWNEKEGVSRKVKAATSSYGQKSQGRKDKTNKKWKKR